MLNKIIAAFKNFLPCYWEPNDEQIVVLEKLINYANKNNFGISDNYEENFIEAVNNKLDLNKDNYKEILNCAFRNGIKLNYMLKTSIRRYLDCSNMNKYLELLKENNIFSESMVSIFKPVKNTVPLQAIKDIYISDLKYLEIFASIFSRFCFNLFPKNCAFSFFSEEQDVDEDYFCFIKKKYPDLLNRSNALYIIDIPKTLFATGYEIGCNSILNAIQDAFYNLNNHCNLVVHIPNITLKDSDIQWKLYSDIILYAEKHNKEKIPKSYFRWEKIGKQTIDYIKNLHAYNAEFEFAFQGFVFKDCFILGKEESPYSLLLVFEKNTRDEREINCPACLTKNIQGNSYPILNVKSWECLNPLCPDRSKYNRGKRYSFVSLFRQKEMLNDENIIPLDLISKWHLDCQSNASFQDALKMVIHYYSCVNDTIIFVSETKGLPTLFERKVIYKHFERPVQNVLSEFKASAYFYRYIKYNDKKSIISDEWEKEKTKFFLGDALEVLRNFKNNSIDCAVTSPPYYNAKSYSQWANIYCYLYDMYNINLEVYRTLKNGAVYLYNIFDYFDNENNVALSAMGNKRMILGAYMIDIFERIGFNVCGNIIWNKGEIQGNRSFNQGNLTPYYQAPLNCWEHIFILSKGQINDKFKNIKSCIKDIKPVIKIVKGKNILGHDAPFPTDIPKLVIENMNDNDIVLDPFLGSGTTCITALKHNMFSIGIEKNKNYFELCKRLLNEELNQNSLFYGERVS